MDSSQPTQKNYSRVPSGKQTRRKFIFSKAKRNLLGKIDEEPPNDCSHTIFFINYIFFSGNLDSSEEKSVPKN